MEVALWFGGVLTGFHTFGISDMVGMDLKQDSE